jgi:hypothetical protein
MLTAKFKRINENSDFPPDLVVNVEERRLCWKKLLSRTYTSKEEKSARGFKASKDRLNSARWRERIRNSTIKAITGVPLRNSQSNEKHSKISFASHLDL